LINIIKIILDGDWVIDEIVFAEMLKMSGIEQVRELYWE
jgi:hypothetical protein